MSGSDENNSNDLLQIISIRDECDNVLNYIQIDGRN